MFGKVTKVVLFALVVPLLASQETELPRYVKGEYLVKFRSAPSGLSYAPPLHLGELLGRELPFKVLKVEKLFSETAFKKSKESKAFSPPRSRKLPSLPKWFWVRVSGEENEEDREKILAILKSNPLIEYAEPNLILRTYRLPNDPYYHSSGSWGQSYDDLWGLKIIKAAEAWNITTGSEQIIIAVSDTGVDYNHEDIRDNMWQNPNEIPNNGLDDDDNGIIDDIYGANFVKPDEPTGDPMDNHGHGTHCAGTIAARGNNNLGIVGVNWQAKIMAVKFIEKTAGSVAGAIKTITYAVQHGARVINMSWGAKGFSQALKEVVDYAHSQGCILVAAAGNSNEDVLFHTPANLRNVITVASSDQNDKRSEFSNYGFKIDIAAPGGGSSSEHQDRNILSLRAQGTDMYEDSVCIVGEKYYRARGTSMAAPHVSGLAALLLAKNTTLTNEEIRAILKETADDIETEEDKDIGAGRINAEKALKYQGRPLVAHISNLENESYIMKGEAIEVKGTVSGDNFSYYQLVIKKLSSGEEQIVKQGNSPVENALLGNIIIPSQMSGFEYEVILRTAATTGETAEDKVRIYQTTFAKELTLNEEPFWHHKFSRVSTDWGDYDNDGDLDLAVIGSKLEMSPDEFTPPAKVFIYQNQNGVFHEIFLFKGTLHLFASIKGSDYDGDGDLDLLITYTHEAVIATNRLIPEGELEFSIDRTSLTIPVPNESILNIWEATWGDYDSDGDLDIILAANIVKRDEYHMIRKLYQNKDGDWQDVSNCLPNSQAEIGWENIQWVDYDNDGDLDLSVIESDKSWSSRRAKLYENRGSYFNDRAIFSIEGYWGHSRRVIWADFDNDSDLDFGLVAGVEEDYKISFYQNQAGKFNLLTTADDIEGGGMCWGDYDNDGDLDIAVAHPSKPLCFIYQNNDLSFEKKEMALYHPLAWIDYDQDGVLDLMTFGNGKFILWKSNIPSVNTPPTPPQVGFNSLYTGEVVTLSWAEGADNETPAQGLYYNIKLGSVSGGQDIISCGNKLSLLGNRGGLQGRKVVLRNLGIGTYYWRVQTIDTGLAKSVWSAEQTFVISNIGCSISDISPRQAFNKGVCQVTIKGKRFRSGVKIELLREGEVSIPAQNIQLIDAETIQCEFNLENKKVGFWSLKATLPNGLYSFLEDCFKIINVAFTKDTLTFPEFRASSSLWGDYDNDGDLDLALEGALEGDNESSEKDVLRIYQNENSEFKNFLELERERNWRSKVYLGDQWEDFDNDGDLDIIAPLLIQRDNEIFYKIEWWEFKDSEYLKKELGIEKKIGDGELIPLSLLELFFVFSFNNFDFDNDGDLDFIISLYDESQRQTTFTAYQNQLGSFEPGEILKTNSYILCWQPVDYDSDGDLDLLIRNIEGSESEVDISLQIYENERGVFSLSKTFFSHHLSNPNEAVGVYFQPLPLWADYDNDGDLDFIIDGLQGGKGDKVSVVYQNENNEFTEKAILEDTIPSNLFEIDDKPYSWVDYDCNGNLDLAIVRQTSGLTFYNNQDNNFTKLDFLIDEEEIRDYSWADYDDDKDLDLLLISNNQPLTLYSIQPVQPNTPPSPPSSGFEVVSHNNGYYTLKWGAGSDNETPKLGLYYSLRLGTEPGKGDIISPQYTTLLMGNRGGLKGRKITLKLAPGKTYYWSVKAIDTAFCQSPWSEEQVISITATGLLSRRAPGADYPNPFNSTIHISYPIRTEFTPSVYSGNSELRTTKIKIYNILGQLVRTLLINQATNQLTSSVVWDGRDKNGSKVGSGIYFYRVIFNGKILSTKKFLLLP